MVVNQDLVTDELVEERFADATAPGAQRGDALDGDVVLEPGDRRGRHALARGPQAAQAHPAHLGPRGPRQPARRRAGRAQADPEGAAACLPELRALGADRGGRRVRRGRHGVPGPTRREEQAHDHRHQVHGLRPRGLAPTSTSGRPSPARCSASPRAAGPNPDHQYWRIDQVSARLVVFPADVDQLGCAGWELADHRGAAGGARAPRRRPAWSSRRAPGGARRAPGAGAGPVLATRGTTSSSCSTASPTSRGRSSRRTPRSSSPATRGWATSCCR